jgi:hypothetical protein
MNRSLIAGAPITNPSYLSGSAPPSSAPAGQAHIPVESSNLRTRSSGLRQKFPLRTPSMKARQMVANSLLQDAAEGLLLADAARSAVRQSS